MTNDYLASNVGVVVNRQSQASTGAKKYVFVDIDGIPKVYPPIGGVLQNPFKFGGKAYQGDIIEYSTDGKIKLLKVFKLAKALTADATEMLFYRDAYSHIPQVGDVLMVAPSTLSTTGTAVAIGAVTATTATISSKTVDVWSVAITAADFGSSTIAVDTIFVEGAEAGESKSMYVTNPNGFLEQDIVYNYAPASGDTDFFGARYLFTPILHGVVWKSRANYIPACVDAINKSRVNGWFEL